MFRIATCSLIAALSVAAGAQAGTITSVTLSALDTNGAFNSNLGSTVSHTASLGSASETQVFTVNGLDLTGDGTANDSVDFSYLVEAVGGNIAIVNGTSYSYGVDEVGAGNTIINQDDNEIDPGESLTFSTLAANVTLGDSNAGTLSLVSATFDFFQARFPGGGDVVQLTGSDGITPVAPAVTPNGGGNDPYDFSADPQTAFTVTSGGGNGFGIDTVRANFQFDFEPVPEPGSLALLGLGGLLIARRRRGE